MTSCSHSPTYRHPGLGRLRKELQNGVGKSIPGVNVLRECMGELSEDTQSYISALCDEIYAKEKEKHGPHGIAPLAVAEILIAVITMLDNENIDSVSHDIRNCSQLAKIANERKEK